MCVLCNFCEDSVFFVIFIVRFFISLFYGLFLGYFEDSLHSLQNNKVGFIFISLVCYYL